jgi:hypothetical protein
MASVPQCCHPEPLSPNRPLRLRAEGGLRDSSNTVSIKFERIHTFEAWRSEAGPSTSFARGLRVESIPTLGDFLSTKAQGTGSPEI